MTATSGSAETAAVDFVGVTKRFPGTVALSDVTISLRYGEIISLMGENGAGKSTLLSILDGAQRPDEGHLRRDGVRVDLARPSDAQGLGMAVIHQEPHVAAHLSVAENVLIGRLPSRLGFVSMRGVKAQCARICERLGIDLNPDAIVADLGAAQRQMIEIVKALSMDVRVLALDEPTSSLSSTEAEQLFEVVRRLRDDRVAVLYVSHRMEEVLALSDRYFVLRDGKLVASLDAHSTSEATLIRSMIGRDLNDMFVERTSHAGAEVLRLNGVSTPLVGPIDLTVHSGEIVGIAGLMGSGRSRLVRALGGVDHLTKGAVVVRGQPVRLRGVNDSIAAGISICPEDRKGLALFLDRSIADNIVTGLGIRGHFRIFPRRREEKATVDSYVKRLDLRPPDPQRLVRTLSGGNAQKVVLARWLAHRPDVLVLDEPTRGIDIGAKSEIYALLRELAAAGTAVIVCSSELVELLGLSDRIYVMRESRIVGELDGGSADEESIMRLAVGAVQEEGRAA